GSMFHVWKEMIWCFFVSLKDYSRLYANVQLDSDSVIPIFLLYPDDDTLPGLMN
ncbi:hypothetical protein PAXRUDRAFT_173587, partial [Paxillus rubicundulus Ve08.2h10]